MSFQWHLGTLKADLMHTLYEADSYHCDGGPMQAFDLLLGYFARCLLALLKQTVNHDCPSFFGDVGSDVHFVFLCV